MQRGFAQLLIVAVVLVLFGVIVGYFYLKNGSAPVSLIPHPANTQSTESIYKSSEFNFEFEYPKGMVALADTEEEYSKRNNGDARKNFAGYVQYQPGKFLGAVYLAKDKNSAEGAPFTVWVFENVDNLSVEGWFSKYWYYPFMWGDFTYDGKLKLAPKDESTVSGQLVKSATVSYQEGSPKYIYIPKDKKMFLIRVLEKDKVGEGILSTFKFLSLGDQTGGWKTYINERWSYSFQIPNNWDVSTSDQLVKDQGITIFHQAFPFPAKARLEGSPIGLIVTDQVIESAVSEQKQQFESQGYKIKVEEVKVLGAEKAIRITDLKSGLPQLFIQKSGKTYHLMGGGGLANRELGIDNVYLKIVASFKFL